MLYSKQKQPLNVMLLTLKRHVHNVAGLHIPFVGHCSNRTADEKKLSGSEVACKFLSKPLTLIIYELVILIGSLNVNNTE